MHMLLEMAFMCMPEQTAKNKGEANANGTDVKQQPGICCATV